MTNTTVAFIFVMTVNILLWFGQVAIINVGEAPTTFYNCTGTILDTYGDCESYSITESPDSFLPSSESSLTPTDSNIFTDIFNNVLSWFKGVGTGATYLWSIVSAPYNLLKALLLPTEIAFGLGLFWYGISIFLIISFIWGRE